MKKNSPKNSRPPDKRPHEMDLGERLRFVRQRMQEANRRHFSLEGVARRTAVVSRQGLSQIELGKIKNPSVRVLAGIALDLGVSVEYLLTGVDRRESARQDSRKRLQERWGGLREKLLRAIQEGVPHERSEALHDRLRSIERAVSTLLAWVHPDPARDDAAFAGEWGRMEGHLAALERALEGGSPEAAVDAIGCLEGLGGMRRGKEGGREKSAPAIEEFRSLVDRLEQACLALRFGKAWTLELEGARLSFTYQGTQPILPEWLEEFQERVRWEWSLLTKRAGARASGPPEGRIRAPGGE